MVKAYFIGGPDDLTVRMLPDALHVFEVALFNSGSTTHAISETSSPNDELPIKRGRYYCVGELPSYRGTYIYEWGREN